MMEELLFLDKTTLNKISTFILFFFTYLLYNNILTDIVVIDFFKQPIFNQCTRTFYVFYSEYIIQYS